MKRVVRLALVLACWPSARGAAQVVEPRVFTHADTLRGSITPERAWWDVAFYDLHVAVNPADSSIRGYNGITYTVTGPAREMQVDLMTPLEIDSVVQDGAALGYRRDGNAFFVSLAVPQRIGERKTVVVYYHGKPRVAKKAPWDGGMIWTRDSLGNAWVSTACQGLGASVWWPNKDTQADEPDSQRVAVTVPDPMVDVSNGRLRSTTRNADKTTTYEWFVSNPINNYDVAINAGAYAHFADTLAGERGTLSMDFWPLAANADKARAQFAQAKPVVSCFEHWFGPFPWYEDGYKLVEAPFLGMEHQSAVAYGNGYANGYLGRDLSHTGLGLGWDFIIVHESGHEWFGNNVTTKDIADMWVHESFTNYAEGLYTECRSGKEAGGKYVIGMRKNVQNDVPVISHYGVNEEGSGDMYYKGSNMLHTMRQVVNDDGRWRAMLRGLNETFRHRTVTGAEVQAYVSRATGVDFTKVFEQYLTTTKIPVLEYRISKRVLSYRWADAVPGFDMPVRVFVGPGRSALLRPGAAWKTLQVRLGNPAAVRVDENFYVIVRDLDHPVPAATDRAGPLSRRD